MDNNSGYPIKSYDEVKINGNWMLVIKYLL